ncbi:MAG: class I SAM-dependent methyltransferase [Phycisphaerales bacterium]
MPMTQQDIRTHYESEWKNTSDAAPDTAGLRYSNEIEDAVLYPAYERLVADLGLKIDGARVLDVGSGAGRWIRFLTQRWRPARLVGVDYTEASVELLRRWHESDDGAVEFRLADITRPGLDLGGTFDLVNVANVLFHIPEPDLFAQALANLASLLDTDGAIVTTEYLPRCTMRTEWMMVRSRYEFAAACAAAGLRIAQVRAFGFFTNDPMGLDGPDDGTRRHFHKVRAGVSKLLGSNLDEQSRAFLVDLLTEIELATVGFARERVAEIDLPAQKLVVLRKN